MTATRPDALIRALPKAELHLHLEGTLEPELAFDLASRHGVELPYEDVEALRAAYDFDDLQSFLDVYYAVADVLRDEEDFRRLAAAYLDRAAADGVRHAEVFFDPQTHTDRGIAIEAVIDGIVTGLEEGARRHGMTTGLILCFLRHLPAEQAMATYEAALARREHLLGVGLDSAEVGNPPRRFVEVFDRARADGLHVVAHAGEEGPPAYVREALDLLRVERIDHGVRVEEDEALLARVVDEGIPLTVCPLSNVRLRVFERMEDHNLRRLHERGVRVTVSSDDPAYFGGYVNANYEAAARALDLDATAVARIARQGFEAAFLAPDARARHLAAFDEALEGASGD